MTDEKPVRLDIFGMAFRVLASNGLATILLLLLFLLTLLGTLDQVDMGIAEVQKKYFSSLYVVYDLFGAIPIPLPGAYLVMILLVVNVVVGGIVNVRWKPAKIGVLISHIGIVLLFGSGFFIYQLAERAELALEEGQARAYALAESDWEIVIAPTDPSGSYDELIIPEADFGHLDGDDERSFWTDDLPFDLLLARYWKNPSGTRARVDVRIPLPQQHGYHEFALFGGHRPHRLPLRSQSWELQLRRKRVELPFTVRLDSFEAKYHPGTGRASGYQSDVTLFDDEGRRIQEAQIYMNHPLRRGGFVFYQSSFQGQRLSVLEVVENPADQFPLFATIVIGIGMLIHFTRKLFRYLAAEGGRRS